MPDETINMIVDRLDRIEDKIDSIMLHGCSKNESHQDHEKRLRSIEEDRSKAIGIISFCSLIFGAVGAKLFQLFQK
jgi:archaellum component FlaC